MSRVGRGSAVLLLTAVWLSAVGPVMAGEPTDLIRQTTDQVFKILEDPQFQAPARQAERQELLHKIANQVFDWQEVGRRALGVHWRERTPQEREEFVRLFKDLVEDTYISRLEASASEKRDVQYVGEQIDGPRAVVRTNVVTRRNTQVPIEYRLHQVNGRWLIYDVLIEGISLVNNYRSQFNQIIGSSSYSELIRKMKAREGAELTGTPERKVQ
jgi:phospholipid transport system substrate-binding protein